MLAPPHRLNADPPVLWGCTSPELARLFGLGFMLWGPICAVVVAAAGVWLLWFGITPLAATVTAWMGAKRVRDAKRGKPDQFFRQRALLTQERLGFTRARLTQRSGPWSVGRTHGLS